jgi:hypothetical protein
MDFVALLELVDRDGFGETHLSHQLRPIEHSTQLSNAIEPYSRIGMSGRV